MLGLIYEDRLGPALFKYLLCYEAQLSSGCGRSCPWALTLTVIAISFWRFDFVVDARLIQFLEQSSVEVFPVEIAEVGRNCIDAHHCKAAGICLELLQHLSNYPLLRAPSQCCLTDARWTTDENQRTGDCFAYSIGETFVGFFEFRMGQGV